MKMVVNNGCKICSISIQSGKTYNLVSPLYCGHPWPCINSLVLAMLIKITKLFDHLDSQNELPMPLYRKLKHGSSICLRLWSLFHYSNDNNWFDMLEQLNNRKSIKLLFHQTIKGKCAQKNLYKESIFYKSCNF